MWLACIWLVAPQCIGPKKILIAAVAALAYHEYVMEERRHTGCKYMLDIIFKPTIGAVCVSKPWVNFFSWWWWSWWGWWEQSRKLGLWCSCQNAKQQRKSSYIPAEMMKIEAKISEFTLTFHLVIWWWMIKSHKVSWWNEESCRAYQCPTRAEFSFLIYIGWLAWSCSSFWVACELRKRKVRMRWKRRRRRR